MSEMLCSRPGCTDKENRIDGYCSVYCRDVHEEQIENAELQRKLDEAEKERDGWKRTWEELHAMSEHDAAEVARLREEMKGMVRVDTLKRLMRLWHRAWERTLVDELNGKTWWGDCGGKPDPRQMTHSAGALNVVDDIHTLCFHRLTRTQRKEGQ